MAWTKDKPTKPGKYWQIRGVMIEGKRRNDERLNLLDMRLFDFDGSDFFVSCEEKVKKVTEHIEDGIWHPAITMPVWTHPPLPKKEYKFPSWSKESYGNN